MLRDRAVASSLQLEHLSCVLWDCAVASSSHLEAPELCVPGVAPSLELAFYVPLCGSLLGDLTRGLTRLWIKQPQLFNMINNRLSFIATSIVTHPIHLMHSSLRTAAVAGGRSSRAFFLSVAFSRLIPYWSSLPCASCPVYWSILGTFATEGLYFLFSCDMQASE